MTSVLRMMLIGDIFGNKGLKTLSDAESFRLDQGVEGNCGKPKHIDDIHGQYMGLLKFTLMDGQISSKSWIVLLVVRKHRFR